MAEDKLDKSSSMEVHAVSGSSPDFKKADPIKRIIGFVIDVLVTVVLSWIPGVGGILGALYMLFRDALPIQALEFKSPGKKLMNLSVVLPANPSAKIDYATSAQRNWMFALGPIVLFLMFIPILGWILGFLVGIAALVLIILEVVKVFSDPKGRRIGDKMAGTMVIEK
jgi:uncharacterized membrane protein